jgi:1,2-diacylglycerol 3-beta-glucosyltransferase
MAINLTWLSYLMAGVVAYYSLLFLLSLRKPRLGRQQEGLVHPLVIFVIAAHNEELVIGQTLASLVGLRYDDLLVFVMNDGSSDRTSEIAHAVALRDSRVTVVDRGPDIAGRGKGEVLNHAFQILRGMLIGKDARLQGRTAEDIIVAVVDGDAQLDPDTLVKVLPLFQDPKTGGAQIGVRIQNATSNVLARMQDMEFIGFSAIVQIARTHLGSVGLGGNGQFTRLSALISMKRNPWSKCLTEDLDLGLSLVKEGWRMKFCADAFVSQQGLTRLRPFLRQRTRWIQGHYQCWSHLPSIWRSNDLSLVTKVDLSLYLVMVVLVVLVTLNMAIAILGIFGFVTVTNNFLSWWPEGHIHNVFTTLFTFGPLFGFLIYYQMKALKAFRWWELPAYACFFSLYCYVSFLPTLRAWGRLMFRKGGWVKTPRLALQESVD